jgi:hypothetical protein
MTTYGYTKKFYLVLPFMTISQTIENTTKDYSEEIVSHRSIMAMADDAMSRLKSVNVNHLDEWELLAHKTKTGCRVYHHLDERQAFYMSTMIIRGIGPESLLTMIRDRDICNFTSSNGLGDEWCIDCFCIDKIDDYVNTSYLMLHAASLFR